MMLRIPALHFFALAVVVMTALTTAGASLEPLVSKVEPPNWWADHSIDPVRLLIRGANLIDARIESDDKRVKVGSVRSNDNGTYVFADLSIESGAAAGAVSLTLHAKHGNTTVPFELSEPLEPTGRFQGFSSDDVIYLLMPDRFANGDPSNDNPQRSSGLLDRKKGRAYHGGDLQGVIDRLPYLKDLGITALWMNPVYDNSDAPVAIHEEDFWTDYHGYGAVDFYAVDEHLGDLQLMRELVDRAHGHGIKVIQDQVANHTGVSHPWIENSPTPTWYNGTQENHLSNNWKVWTPTDPYATPETLQPVLDGWLYGILPDLNQNDPEVSRYLIQNTLWWIGMTGLDGIRQDTLPYVHRRFWRDWTDAIRAEYPQFKVLGEMFDGNAAKVAFFQGGRERFDGIDSGIDALFDFPVYHAIRDVFAKGYSFHDLATVLSFDRLYEDPDLLVPFLGLHDVSRFMNEPDATVEKLTLAYTFLMTARGIPLVYSGDEIAMPGGDDPDNRRDFPGGWPEDARDAFTEQGRTAEEKQVFNRVRTLARLRAETPALRRGLTRNLLVEDRVYCYARIEDGEMAIVALNNGSEAATIACPAAALEVENGTVLKSHLNTHQDVTVENGQLQFRFAPLSGAVFTLSR